MNMKILLLLLSVTLIYFTLINLSKSDILKLLNWVIVDI